MKKEGTISVFYICLVAMAAAVNVIGGQIALLLRLPVYLDSIGTVLTGALAGPVYGLIPGLLSGIIMGVTDDIYSLYYAPVGMITGLMAGVVWSMRSRRVFGEGKLWFFAGSAMVSLPGSIVSSIITAVLFGGVTSSGSTVIVQLLAKTVLGMTASIFLVQFVTDYLDRLISMFLVSALMKVLPADIKRRFMRNKELKKKP